MGLVTGAGTTYHYCTGSCIHEAHMTPQNGTAQMALVSDTEVLMLVKHSKHHRTHHSQYSSSQGRTGSLLLQTENNPLCFVKRNRFGQLRQEVGQVTSVCH